MLEHVLEPTLQWSAVLLIHTKARQSVPLTNVENQTEGMRANSLVKSLSRNVIMLPLYCPTVVKVPVYWSLALKSCIFNCGRSQTSSFCHQRQFFFISLLPFVLSTFQLFFFLHQHHIFIVFLLFHLNIIDPTSTLDGPHIEPHFIHELKTKGYDVIGANGFLRKLMIF